MFLLSKKIAFMSMFMASRKQTLEREYQTYTVRPLSISTTTQPKLSYQVLGEHHKDRAEERAARRKLSHQQNIWSQHGANSTDNYGKTHSYA